MSDCNILVSWKAVENDSIIFELSGNFDYVAIGFSKDRKMGDDSIECCLKSNNSIILNSYYSKRRSLIEKIEHSSTKLLNYTIFNRRIECIFQREIISHNHKIFNLNKSYYLLFATGLSYNSEINYHKNRYSTDEILSFNHNINIYHKYDANNYVKAHGCLMVISWAFFIPVGIFIARHFKYIMNGHKSNLVKEWFFVSFNFFLLSKSKIILNLFFYKMHRFFVISGTILSIIGVLLIFIHVKGYSQVFEYLF